MAVHCAQPGRSQTVIGADSPPAATHPRAVSGPPLERRPAHALSGMPAILPPAWPGRARYG